MTCGIYKITNTINGKAYIGASSNIEKRWSHHRTKHETRMSDIIKKYGVINFTFEIIEECPKEELIEKEQYYVKFYDTEKPKGYNLTKGGEHSHNTTGYAHVSKIKNKKNKLGYVFVYVHYSDGNRAAIESGSLEILKHKVEKRGWVWEILDDDLAENILQKNIKDLKRINYKPKPENSTGFYGVHRNKSRGYVYQHRTPNERKSFESVDIRKLQEKVERNGYRWEIIDEEKAKNTIRQSDEYNKLTPHQKRSKMFNQTGFYRVYKIKSGDLSSGFRYGYQYPNHLISCVCIKCLQDKVEEKGLPWIILDEEKALKTIQESEKNHPNYTPPDFSNKTGFLRVGIIKTTQNKQGLFYRYSYYDNGVRRSLASADIKLLSEKVKNKGLPWRVIDEEKAKQTIKESEQNNGH